MQQRVDRRDIADFMVLAAERRLAGLYNAIGPAVTFRELLESSRRVVGGAAEVVWVGDEHPDAREVRRLVPGGPSRTRAPGFAAISSAKARAAGFRARTLDDSHAADWLWFREKHQLDFDFQAAGYQADPTVEARAIAAAKASPGSGTEKAA